MCGIVGLYYKDTSRTVPESLLRKMSGSISHRGPDGEGIHIDRNFAMGMRRLAIIDVDGGSQPIFNEDCEVAVVFNGEIYNYPELKSELQSRGHIFRTRTDTEVLVHGYESWGLDLPRRLNGMFAFSIWDRKRRRVVLARDQLGIKPLYVYENDEVIAWASEVKALMTMPAVRAELDIQALFDFLSYGYVPAPRTMFQNVLKFSPAQVRVIGPSGCGEQRYWDLTFDTQEREPGEWIEEIRSLVDDSVRRQLMSDVPLGAFLSGGIDSSTIVATMKRLGVKDVSTYAIGFPEQDAYHSELAKAASVAKRLGTRHHEIVVEPDVTDLLGQLTYYLDEPVTDTSFLVTYLVSKLASNSVKVILSGVGGDEVFAGYRRYLWPGLDGLYRFVPRFVDQQVVRPLVSSLPVDRGSRLKSFCRYGRSFLDHIDKPDGARYESYVSIFQSDQRCSVLSKDFIEEEQKYVANGVAQCYENAVASNRLNRMLYADVKTSLVDSLLMFTDKMSMAVSIEARVPLLDTRLVELAARVPSSLKLKGVRGLKHIFKSAMSDRLPPAVIHQRKQGFGTPISSWLRESLRPVVEDLLAPERICRRGYFNPEAVRSLLDEHLAERSDNSEHLVALVTFELWHQHFLDA